MTSIRNITISSSNGTNFNGEVESLVAESKYQVFKVKIHDKTFGMKVFPSLDKQFQTEASFSYLTHPNILVTSLVGTCTNEANEPLFLILSEFCKNGTFFDILREKNAIFDEKLTRTYFRQLVDAVDYLHKNGVYHLDIKLQNIFVDEKFRLRLADFDLAHTQQNPTFSKGTEHYRAPEQLNGFFDPEAADVFQMGIVLFLMFNGGKIFPYYGTFSREFLEQSPNSYWGRMKKGLRWTEDRWSQDFKDLFIGMTCKDPLKRLTIEEIKQNKWFQGEVYKQSEIEVIMTGDLE